MGYLVALGDGDGGAVSDEKDARFQLAKELAAVAGVDLYELEYMQKNQLLNAAQVLLFVNDDADYIKELAEVWNEN